MAREAPDREEADRLEVERVEVDRLDDRPVDFLADGRVGAGRRFVVTTVGSRVVLGPGGIADTPGTNHPFGPIELRTFVR